MSIKTMQLGVSKNLLTKVPRYFGAPNAILRELFQNTYRAGAKNVTIAYKENILRFEDDGCGSDADSLLIAGESGWDESSIAVDPAGLGAFSFLRPEYVESVRYRSRDWHMTLSPSDLDTGHVDVEDGLDEVSGMSVELTLTDQVKFSAQDFTAARALYPMAVMYREGDDRPEELKLVPIVPDDFRVSVPHAGLVGFTNTGSGHYRRIEAHVVWQYAYFSSRCLEDALEKAIDNLRDSNERALAQSIFHNHNAVFFVDPSSGIRPKLPDREELINDHHLHDAAKRIVRAVLDEYVLAFDMKAIKALPEVIEIHAPSAQKEFTTPFQWLLSCAKKDSLPTKLLREGICIATFQFFGFEKVDWDDPAEIQLLTVDEGDGDFPRIENLFSSHGSDSFYIRRDCILNVLDEGLRTSLCLQGLYAKELDPRGNPHTAGTSPRIEALGLRYEPGDWLAFADSILVNGKPVDYLARSNPSNAWGCSELDAIDVENEAARGDAGDSSYGTAGNELVLVTAVPPARFLSELDKAYVTWRGYIAWMFDDLGIVHELAEYKDGEYEWGDNMIETAIRQAAIQWLDRNLVEELGRREAIENTLERLGTAKWNIDLRISSKWKELMAKFSIWLVHRSIDLAKKVLESRSAAINARFNQSVQKSL